MTAVCGYRSGDFNSPAACTPGFGCVKWESPAVFGCTSGASTIVPTTCVAAGEQQTAVPMAGVVACDSNAPYCATISLYWSGAYYTHWECVTQPGETAELLATPTVTGDGAVSTLYLNADPLATATSPGSGSSAANNNNGGVGGSSKPSTGVIVGIVCAVSAAISAVAAVGLWFCTKIHNPRPPNPDDSSGGLAVVPRPPDVALLRDALGQGRGVNVYINELHYHNHRPQALRLGS